jgi:hypothetical protein
MVQRSGTIPNRFFELTRFLSSPFLVNTINLGQSQKYDE